MNLKMIATDFDGTLANDASMVSEVNRNTLHKLGELGVCRVIATGRSLFTLNKAIEPDFPIDYAVFSTGSGIIEWKTKELIFKSGLDAGIVKKAATTFMDTKHDFMIHQPVPENYRLAYHSTGAKNIDFSARVKWYGEYATPLSPEIMEREASQLLAVIPPHRVNEFDELKESFSYCNVIKTTSPVSNTALWMELFPMGISKGSGLSRLGNMLGISKDEVATIGNDFNDTEMLEWTKHSYVVDNAPSPMKSYFRVTKSNEENGFTEMVKNYFTI